MGKQKKAAAKPAVANATNSKRAGYKRNSGKARINQLQDQLDRQARKALRRAQYDKSCTWAQPPRD